MSLSSSAQSPNIGGRGAVELGCKSLRSLDLWVANPRPWSTLRTGDIAPGEHCAWRHAPGITTRAWATLRLENFQV
eukprot:4839711-Pyramimonas_sp.AAC.1